MYVLDIDRRHGRSPAVRSISDLQHGYPAVPVTRDVIAQTSRRSLAAPRCVVSPKRLRNFEFENVYDDCIMNYFQISSISIYSAFLEEQKEQNQSITNFWHDVTWSHQRERGQTML